MLLIHKKIFSGNSAIKATNKKNHADFVVILGVITVH